MRIEVKESEKDTEVVVKVSLRKDGNDVHICLERGGESNDIGFLTICRHTKKIKLSLLYNDYHQREFFNLCFDHADQIEVC